MAKRLPWRRVKTHRSYTFDEAARLLGVHKNTVRNWVRGGLVALVEARPYLILGRDLRGFLDARQKNAKQELGPSEMFCLSCRKPRTPPPGLVEGASGPVGPSRVRGICPVCATVMNRSIRRDQLSGFLANGAEHSDGERRQ